MKGGAHDIYPTKAGMLARFNATEERAAIKLAARLSSILGFYVEPYEMRLYPARGFWTHSHQDVQRFEGSIKRSDVPKLTYTFGSYDMTLSRIAKGCRFLVSDCRGTHRKVLDFDICANHE
jgi:hypothetical protein